MVDDHYTHSYWAHTNRDDIAQGWPTFLASGPNFWYVSVGGPKISSKKIWQAKKGIFSLSFI